MAKFIETRSWKTHYRGPLAIHAAKTQPKWARELTLKEPFFSVLKNAGFNYNSKRGFYLPTGVIVATCILKDCILMTPTNQPGAPERHFGDYRPGRYMWMLGDINPLKQPVPVAGRQRLWKVPETILL